MTKIKVYTEQGKERWMSPGQIVPAGWFDKDCNPLVVDHVVMIGVDEGNPYEQYSSVKKFPVLAKKRD